MKAQRRWGEIGAFLLLASALLACQGEGGTATAATTVQSNPIPPGDVLVPASLGTIKESFAGAAGHGTIFVIGENHVNLEIQRKVADLLTYLRSAYGLSKVCSEGTSGLLEIPRLDTTPVARRDVAEAELAGRQINGLEFFALAYPGIQVIGVEDMQAYEAHRSALESLASDREAWGHDFEGFLTEGLSGLTEDQIRQVEDALKKLGRAKDKGMEEFFKGMRTILGPDSAEGRRFAELMAARDEMTKRNLSLTSPDNPLMIRRDEGMAREAASVATGVEPVALVVGTFHLPGITQKLKAAGQPYVSIQITGAEVSINVDDGEVFASWSKGDLGPLEAWLDHGRIKNRSALERETKRREVAVMGALFHAHRLLSEGSSIEQVRTVMGGVVEGLEITDSYPIDGGYGIEFKISGKSGRAYFSSKPLPALTAADYPTRIQKGQAGDLYYGVFDGGSGGPPNIPHLPTPPSDGDPFNRRLVVAVSEQRRKNPEAVTVALLQQAGGALVLYVGDRRRPLSISKDDLQRLVEAYAVAQDGPELLWAAQKLAAALLRDIDEDLPPDARSLYLISQNDLLRDLSLPQIAALAKEPGTARLAGLGESYVLPWKKAQRDLDPLSRARAPVEIGKTVFWIGEELEKNAQHAAAVAAIRQTGVRVNEPLQPGDTLVLLGTGAAGWSARLTDNTKVSATAKAVRSAGTIFSLGVKLAKDTAVDALTVHEMEGDQALAFGRDLAERIRKESGKEPLDRIVRRQSEERIKDSHDLARRSLVAKFSEAEKAQRRVDRTATTL